MPLGHEPPPQIAVTCPCLEYTSHFPHCPFEFLQELQKLKAPPATPLPPAGGAVAAPAVADDYGTKAASRILKSGGARVGGTRTAVWLCVFPAVQ